MTIAKAGSATQSGVAAAASSMLARGNAVDAVCAGVLMAAALEPGVLLGPLHVLVAGPGFGLRCVDGRLRQPGRGAPRPRGFLARDEIPRAARVAVPALPAAIATTLAMFGTSTPKRASEPALDALTRNHPRRTLLSALAREGPSVLAKDPFGESLVAAAGRFASGQLTRDDLRAVRSPVVACQIEGRAALAPVLASSKRDSAECHVVCAADHRGAIAIACYEIAREGLPIDALGLLAPLRADAVMRGERRTDPGSALDATTTIALVASDGSNDERFDVAIGFAGDDSRHRLATTLEALDAAETLTGLTDLIRKNAPSAAVVQAARGPKAYSFTP